MYNLKVLTRSTFGNGTEHKEAAQVAINVVPQIGSLIEIDGLSHIVKNIQYNITKNVLSYDSAKNENNQSFLKEKKQDVLNEVLVYCDIC